MADAVVTEVADDITVLQKENAHLKELLASAKHFIAFVKEFNDTHNEEVRKDVAGEWDCEWDATSGDGCPQYDSDEFACYDKNITICKPSCMNYYYQKMDYTAPLILKELNTVDLHEQMDDTTNIAVRELRGYSTPASFHAVLREYFKETNYPMITAAAASAAPAYPSDSSATYSEFVTCEDDDEDGSTITSDSDIAD
jgi:hypothetical protein